MVLTATLVRQLRWVLLVLHGTCFLLSSAGNALATPKPATERAVRAGIRRRWGHGTFGFLIMAVTVRAKWRPRALETTC